MPEDLYAWMDEAIEAADPRQERHPADGAVCAFTALADKARLLGSQASRALLLLLGMVCGGAAAATRCSAPPGAGALSDVAHFELRAHHFLALARDERWSCFAAAQAGHCAVQRTRVGQVSRARGPHLDGHFRRNVGTGPLKAGSSSMRAAGSLASSPARM